jgi:hypothetical protein
MFSRALFLSYTLTKTKDFINLKLMEPESFIFKTKEPELSVSE